VLRLDGKVMAFQLRLVDGQHGKRVAAILRVEQFSRGAASWRANLE
jgi:hypothetical protein